MKKIATINKLIKPLGIEVRKTNTTDISKRIKLLNHFKINKILDVGANVGNYVLGLREAGYEGKVISFEPLSETFKILSKNANRDDYWEVLNMALGDKNEKSIIHIAGNIDSSSLLDMLPSHIKSAPHTKYIAEETIDVATLDSIFDKYCNSRDNIYMKLDTQGFEKRVLDGAKNSLQRIVGLQIELSIIPLYKDSMVYTDMIAFLKTMGYQLYSIESGFFDSKTGQLLQFDGVFYKV